MSPSLVKPDRQRGARREGELIIRFREGVSEQDKGALLNAKGARRKKKLRGRSRIEKLELPAGQEPEAVAESLRYLPAVEFVEPNYLLSRDEMTPNDPRFSGQLSGAINQMIKVIKPMPSTYPVRYAARISLVIAILGVLLFTPAAHADTYDKFRTTRYYSANRQYFVEVNSKRRARLYRNKRRPRIVWTRTLSVLPSELLVTNDGQRVIIIDHYYGNNGDPQTPAVIFLNRTGREIGRYLLGEVANATRVIHTTSNALWYKDARLTPDDDFLVIETIVAKRDPATCMHVTSAEESEECAQSVPYERLSFTTATGEIVSRISISNLVGVNN